MEDSELADFVCLISLVWWLCTLGGWIITVSGNEATWIVSGGYSMTTNVPVARAHDDIMMFPWWSLEWNFHVTGYKFAVPLVQISVFMAMNIVQGR